MAADSIFAKSSKLDENDPLLIDKVPVRSPARTRQDPVERVYLGAQQNSGIRRSRSIWTSMRNSM